MRSHELTIGRTFGLSFDHGEDLFTALSGFCREHGVRQGYIPFFLAGFSELRIVGTCERLEGRMAAERSPTTLVRTRSFPTSTYRPA